MLLPIVRLKQVSDLVKQAIPDYEVHFSFQGAPQRTLGFYSFQTLFVLLVLILPAIFFLGIWGLLVLFIPLLLGVLSYFQYKDTGWTQTGQQQLVLRYRVVSRITTFLLRHKIQSIEMKQGPIQKKLRIMTVEASVKSGASASVAKAECIRNVHAIEIFHWFRHINK